MKVTKLKVEKALETHKDKMVSFEILKKKGEVDKIKVVLKNGKIITTDAVKDWESTLCLVVHKHKNKKNGNR